MLYDTKLEKPEIKTKLRTLAHFIAWLEQQPAARAYDWYDATGCVVCSYLESCGYNEPSSNSACQGVTSDSITDWRPRDYWEIAQTSPWTFGAALKRARAAQAHSL